MTDGLRVASYNVHKCVGTDYRRRPERTAKVIDELQADVVALQEVDRRLGARPKTITATSLRQFTKLEPVDIARNDTSLGWHGNALLLNSSYNVMNVSHLELPGLEPRGAVKVSIETGGFHFAVVAVHLGLLRRSRRAQLARIVASLTDRERARTIILGDFNERRQEKGLEALNTDFTVLPSGRSYPTFAPFAPFDRIAIGRSIGGHATNVHRSKLARRASDHFPVFTDLALRA